MNLRCLIGGFEITCQTLAGELLLDTQIQVLADDAIETSAISTASRDLADLEKK